MIDVKEIYEPKDLNDALAYLNAHDDSKVICGGSDVLVQNREGRHRGLCYVNVRNLNELRGIRKNEKGHVVIGAASSFTEIMNSPQVNEICPLLAQAVSQVGAVQIRNIGTIGGNLCNGVPSADSASAVCVLEADLHIAGQDGIRVVNIRDFYKSFGKTEVGPKEILVAVEVAPKAMANFDGIYIKYAMRKAMDIANVGVSMLVKLDDTKQVIDEIRIAYASMAPVPVRGYHLEACLKGQRVSENLVNIIDQEIDEDVNPRDGKMVSRAFKLKMVREITKRAINDVIVRQGGDNVYSS